MKQFTKRILGNITAISIGGLAGFAVVRWYLSSNLLWLILTIPAVLFSIHNAYMIHKSTKKIAEIRKAFKDKHGFDMYDKEAMEKHLKK